jgi:hypothetical protein
MFVTSEPASKATTVPFKLQDLAIAIRHDFRQPQDLRSCGMGNRAAANFPQSNGVWTHNRLRHRRPLVWHPSYLLFSQNSINPGTVQLATPSIISLEGAHILRSPTCFLGMALQTGTTRRGNPSTQGNYPLHPLPQAQGLAHDPKLHRRL